MAVNVFILTYLPKLYKNNIAGAQQKRYTSKGYHDVLETVSAGTFFYCF